MKVHLEMHHAKGVLFCGSVEAPTVVAAMTLKLQELRMTRQLQPGALRIEAQPVTDGLKPELRARMRRAAR